jgi:sarcosine oxidase
MSRSSFDVAVLGLGAMGSAAAYHLAQRGLKVLGLDQYRLPHSLGSSHGHSRVIRKAYFEAPAYVPLLHRAYALWQQLEADAGRRLLLRTGTLMIGPAESSVIQGTLASVRAHELPHEVLEARELHRRYPPFRPDSDTIAVFEEIGGSLDAEACLECHLALAAKLGCQLLTETAVVGWEISPSGTVRLDTSAGPFEASQLVLAAGPWSGTEIVLGRALPLEVVRKVVFWMKPEGDLESFSPARFPIWVWAPAREEIFYGFPALERPEPQGVKVGIHSGGAPCHPDRVERRTQPSDLQEMLRCLAPHLPSLATQPLHSAVCLYTRTPDEHFILGRHPEMPQVLLAAGFSGHGFKFAPVVGEVLADLATEGVTSHPIDLFSPGRFRQEKPSETPPFP